MLDTNPLSHGLRRASSPERGSFFHLPETGFLRVKKSFIFIAHKARPSGELAKQSGFD